MTFIDKTTLLLCICGHIDLWMMWISLCITEFHARIHVDNIVHHIQSAKVNLFYHLAKQCVKGTGLVTQYWGGCH